MADVFSAPVQVYALQVLYIRTTTWRKSDLEFEKFSLVYRKNQFKDLEGCSSHFKLWWIDEQTSKINTDFKEADSR